MQKRKIHLFRKIIDGSRGVAPIQSESTIDTKTSIDFDRPPALTFASAFLLIYPRGATFLCLRGLSDSNGRERKKKRAKGRQGKKRAEEKRRKEEIHAESRASSTWNALHDHRVRKAQINYIMARLKRMLFNHRPEPP